jgi:hypothetical protein
MKRKMTHTVRTELADAIRLRYQSSTGRQKHRILDEFIASTGYHQKSAIRVLNTPSAPKVRQTRNRPTLYDEAARGTLIVLWEASNRVCGKRLKALLRILLPALERNGHLKLDDAIRAKILAMSAATIDRLLRAPRSVTRSKRRRRGTWNDVGGRAPQAARAEVIGGVARKRGNHSRKSASSRSSSTAHRTCSSKCAPPADQRIGWRFPIRWFIR